MEKFYYSPPAGTPPFEFVFAGKFYTFNPPDQFWKKIPQPAVIGKVPVPGVRHDASEAERFRSFSVPVETFVPDDAKNEKLAKGLVPKPKNYLHLDAHAYAFAMQTVYAGLNQYLVSESKLTKGLADEEARLRAEAEANLAEAKRISLDAARRRAAASDERDELIERTKLQITEEARAKIREEERTKLRKELEAENAQRSDDALNKKPPLPAGITPPPKR